MKILFIIILVFFLFRDEAKADLHLKVGGVDYSSMEQLIEASEDEYLSEDKKSLILKYVNETPGLWIQITKEFWDGLESKENCNPGILLHGLLGCRDVPDSEWQKILDEVVRQAHLPKSQRNPLWPFLIEGGLLAMTQRKDSRTEALTLHLIHEAPEEKYSVNYQRRIESALEKMGGPDALAYLDARWETMRKETIAGPPPPQMSPTAAAIRRRLRDEGRAVTSYRGGSNDSVPDFRITEQTVARNDRFGWMAWLASVALGFGLSWVFRKHFQYRDSK